MAPLLRPRLTFALVHGSYHGGWCWDLLRPELTKRGHAVVVMDLPTARRERRRRAYVRTVTESLTTAGDDVVIVGHSLAGLGIPPLPGTRSVARLVYLCALLPRPGTSFDAAAAGNSIFDHFEPRVRPK